MEICRAVRNLVNIGQKTSSTLHEAVSVFYSIRRHNFVIKHCCAKLNTFYIVDSVM